MRVPKEAFDGDGVGHELDEADALTQRDDLVRRHVEVPSARLGVFDEELVDDAEQLLHYSVLAHVVLALVLDDER